MNRKWALFLVPLALFVCWLAYLGWLVLNRPLQAPGFPLVVSRPQVLASEVDIIAELPEKGGKAKVVKVLYPDEDDPRVKGLRPGTEIRIKPIDECRPVSRVKGVDPPPDWDGPGQYLVPLAKAVAEADGSYLVAPVPASPGFAPIPLPVRIYRDSAEVRAQYARIRKAE